MSSDDTAQFLAGSSDRRQLLTHLKDNPASPAELSDTLPLARRSIQRHLGQFVDRGWAEKSEGVYLLTMAGEVIIDEHNSYMDTLDQIERFKTFFGYLPDADHTPKPQLLASASYVEVTRENPQAPVRHYINSVREFDTDGVRMISPVLSRLFHDVHAELAMDGVHTDLVMSEGTIERARELNPTEFKVVTSVGILDLYRYSDDIEFGLTLSDDRLLMGAYDDQGQLQACVDSTCSELVQWGTQLFEEYRAQATPVEPSFTVPFDLPP